jgi:hypothetical protein
LSNGGQRIRLNTHRLALRCRDATATGLEIHNVLTCVNLTPNLPPEEFHGVISSGTGSQGERADKRGRYLAPEHEPGQGSSTLVISPFSTTLRTHPASQGSGRSGPRPVMIS